MGLEYQPVILACAQVDTNASNATAPNFIPDFSGSDSPIGGPNPPWPVMLIDFEKF